MTLILKVNQQEEGFQTKAETQNWVNFANSVENAEQNGVSAAVAWLKAVRVAELLERMRQINFREETAMKELEELVRSVDELIKSNRGGDTGIHGFIGERAQVYLTNAWSLIKGEDKICELIDDNGMTDYLEKGIAVQQKACKSNGWLGLDHVMRHKEKYPEFKGKYHIPKDFYEEFQRLAHMSQEQAGRLSRHEWNLWKEIQEVKKAGIIVEPMKVTYAEIQRDTIHDTIESNREALREDARRQSEIATEACRPSIQDCIKTAAVSSALEGVLTGSVKALEKRAEGKHFKDFDKQDIKEIGLSAAEGAVKGAVRGAAVYLTENYTPVPGVVAGGAVTVIFESGKALKKYKEGVLSGQECASAISKSALTATAGAIGAKIGGKICPIPIVGEVVGGFIFSFLADVGFDMVRNVWRTAPEGTVPLAA